jgi:hypothetical protein
MRDEYKWQKPLFALLVNFFFKPKFFLLAGWDLNSGLCACKAGTLLLKPYLQPICSGYFEDRVS